MNRLCGDVLYNFQQIVVFKKKGEGEKSKKTGDKHSFVLSIFRLFSRNYFAGYRIFSGFRMFFEADKSVDFFVESKSTTLFLYPCVSVPFCFAFPASWLWLPCFPFIL